MNSSQIDLFAWTKDSVIRILPNYFLIPMVKNAVVNATSQVIVWPRLILGARYMSKNCANVPTASFLFFLTMATEATTYFCSQDDYGNNILCEVFRFFSSPSGIQLTQVPNYSLTQHAPKSKGQCLDLVPTKIKWIECC